jgi:signal transduction histidine kinase
MKLSFRHRIVLMLTPTVLLAIVASAGVGLLGYLGQDSRETTRLALIWLGIALVTAVVTTLVLALHTIRVVQRQIQAVTRSAFAVGAGDLDQVVPIMAVHELGQLASAFNTMARQLREYREAQRVQLTRAQRMGQATIDSFAEPVLVFNSAGTIDMVNPAARRVLAIATAEGGQPQSSWTVPDTIQSPLAEALYNQREYIPENLEEAVLFPTDEQERYFLPRIMPIRDEQAATVGAAVLFEDVTCFRLQDEAKTNLVATASHELKTPLATIRLAIHLLLEEMVGPLTEKQKQLLGHARDHSERLLEMINTMLDLARLEEGDSRLAVHAEAPGTLLLAAQDAIRARAERKGVSVQVEAAADLPPLSADGQRLRQALLNLLDNAITYSPPGSTISMQAVCENEAIVLSVADQGTGIPSEYLPHVFDRFFRVPGRSQGHGAGLGLTIVREIVTAHGGSVACTSRLGEGTKVTLTVPVWSGDSLPETRGTYAAPLA